LDGHLWYVSQLRGGSYSVWMIANGDGIHIGNHDSEIADDRAAQMKYMQTLPYSLAEPGPQAVDGVGNCESRLVLQSPRLSD
jgi:hypothetical protein